MIAHEIASSFQPTPYGFQRAGDRYVVDREEQATLAEMRRLHDEGRSPGEIAKTLRRQEKPARRGDWYAATVRAALREQAPPAELVLSPEERCALEIDRGFCANNDLLTRVLSRLERIEIALAKLVEALPKDEPEPEPLTVSNASLTPAEHRVLGMLRQGDSREEIARRTGCTLSTANKHVFKVFRKLGVHSQRELMRATVSDPLGMGAQA